MSKTKKAQGLSLNMIVVGAIGLVVLVVIIAIFVSSAQKSQKDIDAKQKGSLCNNDLFPDNTYFATITHPADCTKVGGEILIGKYYGTPYSITLNQNNFPTVTKISDSVVNSDGMSYVCCKYKTP